jgi:F-type H+-transporting ATPase subunit epsilon
MANSLTLRVITPDRILLDEPVNSVRLPGVDGSMGILPRHAHMIAALDLGLVEYHDVAGKTHSLFIGGGFAEVRDDVVRVVAPVGEQAEQIDETRARESEQRARARLDQAVSAGAADVETLRAQLALRRALLRLRAVRENRS